MRSVGQWLAVSAFFVAVNAFATGLLVTLVWLLRELDIDHPLLMPLVFLAVLAGTLWVCKVVIEWPARTRARARE